MAEYKARSSGQVPIADNGLSEQEIPQSEAHGRTLETDAVPFTSVGNDGRGPESSAGEMRNLNHSTFPKCEDFDGYPLHYHEKCGGECMQHCFDAVIYYRVQDRKIAQNVIQHFRKFKLRFGKNKHPPKIEQAGNIQTSPYFAALKKCCTVTKTIILLVTKGFEKDPVSQEGCQAIWALVPKNPGLEIIPLLFGYNEDETPQDMHIVDNAYYIHYEPDTGYFDDSMQKRLSRHLRDRLTHDRIRRKCEEEKERQEQEEFEQQRHQRSQTYSPSDQTHQVQPIVKNAGHTHEFRMNTKQSPATVSVSGNTSDKRTTSVSESGKETYASGACNFGPALNAATNAKSFHSGCSTGVHPVVETNRDNTCVGVSECSSNILDISIDSQRRPILNSHGKIKSGNSREENEVASRKSGKRELPDEVILNIPTHIDTDTTTDSAGLKADELDTSMNYTTNSLETYPKSVYTPNNEHNDEETDAQGLSSRVTVDALMLSDAYHQTEDQIACPGQTNNQNKRVDLRSGFTAFESPTNSNSFQKCLLESSIKDRKETNDLVSPQAGDLPYEARTITDLETSGKAACNGKEIFYENCHWRVSSSDEEDLSQTFVKQIHSADFSSVPTTTKGLSFGVVCSDDDPQNNAPVDIACNFNIPMSKMYNNKNIALESGGFYESEYGIHCKPSQRKSANADEKTAFQETIRVAEEQYHCQEIEQDVPPPNAPESSPPTELVNTGTAKNEIVNTHANPTRNETLEVQNESEDDTSFRSAHNSEAVEDHEGIHLMGTSIDTIASNEHLPGGDKPVRNATFRRLSSLFCCGVKRKPKKSTKAKRK